MGKLLFFILLLTIPAFAEEAPQKIGDLREQRLTLLQDQQQLLAKIVDLEKTLQDLSLVGEEKKAQIARHQEEIAQQLPLLTRLGRANPLRLLADPRMTQHAVRGVVLLRAMAISLKHRASALQAELNELALVLKDLEMKTQDHRSLLQAIESRQNQIKRMHVRWQQTEEERLADEDDSATLLRESRIITLPEEEQKARVAATAKGLPFQHLEHPVVGRLKTDPELQKTFNPQSQGIVFETQKNAEVSAPFEGTVVFRGPFRTQEEILIIDHGQHVHTVFMGMHKISADVGQTVYTGERLGTMAGYGKSAPLLYVELRQNGKAIDPKPYF